MFSGKLQKTGGFQKKKKKILKVSDLILTYPLAYKLTAPLHIPFQGVIFDYLALSFTLVMENLALS